MGVAGFGSAPFSWEKLHWIISISQNLGNDLFHFLESAPESRSGTICLPR